MSRRAGKYGDDDDNINSKPPPMPNRASAKKAKSADVYEDAVGLTKEDAPELVHGSMERKESVQERGRRLKQEAMSGQEGPQLIPDTTRLASNDPKETVEQKDLRLKQQAMMGTALGVASLHDEGPELVPDSAEFSGRSAGSVHQDAKDYAKKRDPKKNSGKVKHRKNDINRTTVAQKTAQLELNEDQYEPGEAMVDADVEAPVEPVSRGPQPGAVRVPGIGGVASEDDDLSLRDETSQLPVGTPVVEDEEEENVNPALFSDLAHAEAANPDEVFKNRGGILGWVESHPKISIVLVLLVIGGIVGGIVGGLAGSSPSPAPGPTAAPTTFFEAQVISLVSSFTPMPVLMDESTPQNAALNFLLEDQGNYDIDNDEKVLQRYALATIYYATGGNSSWISQANFLSRDDECEWKGVLEDGTRIGVRNCTQDGLADGFSLATNNLTGTLADEVGLLVGVELLYFVGNNGLGGTFPESITSLPEIKDIRIGDSSFNGTLPASLGKMKGLTNLAVNNCSFSGTLPLSIGNLTLLDQLSMNNNQFSGEVPSEIGALSIVKAWWAEENRLSGSIPMEVSKMSNLRLLYLDKNDFTDGMENFCTISSLTTFRSDCLESSFPPNPPDVSCSCCSACCNDVLEGCQAT